jgi:hypothetical protein
LLSSLFYTRLPTESGEIAYVNVGHLALLLYRCAQSVIHMFKRTGMALGVDIDVMYGYQPSSLTQSILSSSTRIRLSKRPTQPKMNLGSNVFKEELPKHRGDSTEEILDGSERTWRNIPRPSRWRTM